jgi:protocatechuate 3,4-dioxygenase beta subunit
LKNGPVDRIAKTWMRRSTAMADRRQMLFAPMLLALSAWMPRRATVLAATPACEGAGANRPTAPETEGPFFKPRSPGRSVLAVPGMSGAPLLLSGRVLTTGCQPVAGALLDFWQADAGGAYDNTGFRLRGHQFADPEGRYHLQTVVPGLYPGRTRHIHVKVQAPHRPVLTTQLYFPDEPRNAADFLFRRDLLIATQTGAAGASGRFDFVLDFG